MATPDEIMAAVDARLDQLRPAIVAHQDAYAATHNGRRWQGLRSRDDAPSDGVEQSDTVNSTTPTDQLVEWPAVIHQPLPMAMTVDCYDGPHGQGYVMISEVVIGGELYRRSENVGPETYRDADWAKVTTVPFVGVTVDPLIFSCTFNSIGIEARFSETPGHTADLFAVEYKKVGTLAWSPAMPLWPARPTGGQPVAARGSIMFCDPGTDYMVRVTVYSGAATMTLIGIATTRAENIPLASTLVPTHFVRMDGNDANGGTANTAGGAWRTVRRALIAAPAGAIVQAGSGDADEFFVDSGYSNAAPGPRTLPITLVAPFPAVDDERREINHGRRTFIEGSTRAAPTGQTVSGMPTAPWQQVTLTGPLTGRSVSVWKWAGANPNQASVTCLGFGLDRAGEFKRAWRWSGDARLLTSAAAWAEMSDPVDPLQLTWYWGCFQEGPDLYLRLRTEDGNPNQYWWSGGTAAGIALNSPDSRISGFVVRNLFNAVRGGPGMHRLVVDHNDMRMCTSGLRGSGSLPSGYAVDLVFEHNLVRDRGLRSRNQDLVADPSSPWGGTKRKLKLTELGISVVPAAHQELGTAGANKNLPFYAQTRVLGLQEGTAFLNTGTRRSVSRFNTIRGLFNGVGAEDVGGPTAEDVYISAESDVHDNLFLDLADDATEPARSSSNWRVWNNRIDHCITMMSTGGPCAYGPLYYVNNTCFRIGNQGISLNADGLSSQDNGNQEGYVWKFDGSATLTTQPQARIYDVGNTFWSDNPISHGGSPAAGAGNRPEAFYRRNSVYRTVLDVIDYFPDPIGGLDEDYLHWCGASPTSRFFRISPTKGNVGFTTWAEYRADMPTNNVHSNVANPDPHDAVWLDAQFIDAAHGDLRLKPDSALRGLGTYVPNLSPVLAQNLGAS